MRLESSFNAQSSEAVSFRVSESTRTQNNNLEAAIIPREIVLFSKPAKEDPKVPDQLSDVNQTAEPIKTKPTGDWEPFNLEPHPSHNFVNLYSGPFSAQMELNRKNAERLLQVAGIEGKVILSDTPMDGSRSIAGVNPDGSVAGRRRLSWGEEIQDENKSQSLVKSIPQGWRIEIPGQDIMEELSRKESKKPLDKRFVSRFNQQLRQAVNEIIIREKLTSEKNPLLIKIIGSLVPWWVVLFVDIPQGHIETPALYPAVGFSALYYPFMNILKKIAPTETLSMPRNRDNLSLYEYFLPFVEIDRVLRGLVFANLKGRNLVKLKK